ncbi:MAG: DUF3168 domain-containing protein [Pseudomonadota bacterium]
MSYGVSAALQAAVFQQLSLDPVLTGLVPGAIFDAEPSGTLPPTYVSLGPESVRAQSDVTSDGAVHEFQVSIVTEAAGFQGAKDVAAAVSDALVDADLVLGRGELISLRFFKAQAARVDTGTARRIDLTFRARVDDV